LRIARNRRYLRRFHERLGFLAAGFRSAPPGGVWVHAVSVGEALAAAELLRRIRERLPGAPLWVSVGTVAGRAVAEERLAGLATGVFYAPLDYCFIVRRVLRTLRPALVAVVETEIWPNLYREAKRAGCGLVVVNGRISDKAFPRYFRLRRFLRAVLALPDAILTQDEASRRRYLDLGAPAGRVLVGGNLKYDFEPRAAAPPPDLEDLLANCRAEKTWIAASTMPPLDDGDVDEDDAVIDAFQELARRHPGLLLVLAPRRPERFEAAAGKLAGRGAPFVRRSALAAGERLSQLPAVLLLDSIGELAALFAFADVVFMGGSLARRGGHNLLEPAFAGKPVIVGPHMENFAEMARSFRAAGACLEIGKPGELAAAVDALLADADGRARMGAAARRVAEDGRGASRVAAGTIAAVYERALPVRRPAEPARTVLWLLARLWSAGSRLNLSIRRARAARLNAPVISVGGLTVGGSGKTPLVLWLAQRLKEAGLRVAILTRGYRRAAPEKVTLIAPGAQAPAALTGDEAQIFVRSAVGAVGIGAGRIAVGRAIEERFRPDVVILDDGFQHLRLSRDLDIVVLDSLDPFGGGDVLPLGRLREPAASLERAGVVVYTRTEPGRNYPAIDAQVRAYNPAAPIFRSRVRPLFWTDCVSGAQLSPAGVKGLKCAAFCGLANPASFWTTLRGLGCRLLFQKEIADHHRYSPAELRFLAAEARSAGAEVVLTTEKDAMNLCEGAGAIFAPLSLLWLKIGLEVEGGEDLVRLVRGKAARDRLV